MNIELGDSGKIKKMLTLAKPLQASDIHQAIEKYESLHGEVDSYAESTGYDLQFNGKRYPPKAIFGLAMSNLLNFQVLSSHFSGGMDSDCFKVLKKLGFEIVIKPRPSAQEGLFLYGIYSREQLNKIFDPEIAFTRGAGRWGASGIVPNAPRTGDFTFIVTLEDKKKYEDYITADGYIFWESQEQQTPDSKQIKAFCRHDENQNMIYLFMRVSKSDDYTFFGPLAFEDWDPNTSRPVHFKWKFLNWPLPENIRKKFGAHIRDALTMRYQEKSAAEFSIEESAAPYSKGTSSKSYNSSAQSGIVDWAKREERNRALGLAGEQLVLRIEKDRLVKEGRHDLAARVEHIAAVDNNAGYDVKSFDKDGTEKFIEVKTTEGSKAASFFISCNEVAVSEKLREKYWIYRVFEYDIDNQTAKYFTINGPIEDNFNLVADSYRASIK